MGYKTEIVDGRTLTFKTWREYFIDESYPNDITKRVCINRKQIIKIDGRPCNQFGTFDPVVCGATGKKLWSPKNTNKA